jgi:hypothetical protein
MSLFPVLHFGWQCRACGHRNQAPDRWLDRCVSCGNAYKTWTSVVPAGRIHRQCCPQCPSDTTEHDPESLDIAAGVKAGEIRPLDAVFPCGWRRQKLCKGVCDQIGVTEEGVGRK